MEENPTQREGRVCAGNPGRVSCTIQIWLCLSTDRRSPRLRITQPGAFRTFQIGGKSHAAGRKSVCDCPRRDVSERNHCRRQWLLARRETQEGFPAQFKSGFACPRTGEAPGCGSRSRGHIIASKTVSRVLYLTVIYLDAPLPVRSSHPGSGPGKPRGSDPQLPFRCCSG